MSFKKTGQPDRRHKPMSAELAAIRIRPNSEIRRLMNLIMDMPMSQLQLKSKNPLTPALDLIITNVIIKAIETADFRIVSFLLDRMIGPVRSSEPDVGAMREQLRAELELESMAIEDVRRLAMSKRGVTIDVE
jgi:hypothetical protein